MDGGNDDWRPFALPGAVLISALIIAGAVVYSTNSLTGQMQSLETAFKAANHTGGTLPTPTPGPVVTATPAPTQAPTDMDIAGRPFKGNASAKVTIIAVSDFQCPYCSRAEATMSQLMAQYEGKLKYVFFNYPLSFHANAEKAAEAFECAVDQGGDKAYALHDIMFANQSALTVSDLKGYAASISGMDTAIFNSCLDGGSKAQAVAAQVVASTARGVDGTPTYFINGKPVVGAQPISVFQAAIDQALAQAG